MRKILWTLAAAFASPAFATHITLQAGDSITLTPNQETTVTCAADGGNGGGGCNGTPTQKCDDWIIVGPMECSPRNNGDFGDWRRRETRSCRSFNACGALVGQWTEASYAYPRGSCGGNSEACCQPD